MRTLIRHALKLCRAAASSWWRCYARLRRAEVHPSVVINGRPLIFAVQGSKLVLSEGVKINSYTGIGHGQASLSTIAPGSRLILGKGVGLSNAVVCAAKEILVGEGTIIGANAMIIDTDFHRPIPNRKWNNDAVSEARPVKIGKGCFIGARAIILKGVELGDGVVVGAGAVVTHTVPSDHGAFGNPATVHTLRAS